MKTNFEAWQKQYRAELTYTEILMRRIILCRKSGNLEQALNWEKELLEYVAQLPP
jgi:endo-1,4-beta-mannosidase